MTGMHRAMKAQGECVWRLPRPNPGSLGSELGAPSLKGRPSPERTRHCASAHSSGISELRKNCLFLLAVP